MENKSSLFRRTQMKGASGYVLGLLSFKIRGTSARLFSKLIFNGKEVHLVSLFRFTGLCHQLRQYLHIVC